MSAWSCSCEYANMLKKEAKIKYAKTNEEEAKTISNVEQTHNEAEYCTNKLVIGPNGELSNCILFYYEDIAIENIRNFDTVKEMVLYINNDFTKTILSEMKNVNTKYSKLTHPCETNCAAKAIATYRENMGL